MISFVKNFQLSVGILFEILSESCNSMPRHTFYTYDTAEYNLKVRSHRARQRALCRVMRVNASLCAAFSLILNYVQSY